MSRFLRLATLPVLLLGMAGLVTGIWGGIARLPVVVPLPKDNANWITYHGPLMVCGFLGTVIGLERAVGLAKIWFYAAPALTGLGSALFAAGYLGVVPPWLITAGSFGFLVMAVRIYTLQRTAHTVMMAVAALSWCIGNLLWSLERTVPQVVPWWITFLGLTIVAERLELARYQKHVPWSRPLLSAVVALWVGGAAVAMVAPSVGVRLLGAGIFGAACWLGRFDIVRITIRHQGLPRFMAITLIGGYVWLAVSGLLFIGYGPQESGLRYDASLHTFFLGFVFMMIFAHAPLIFPAVLRFRPLPMSSRFYVHVTLLHLSLLMRVAGDVAGSPWLRQWGAVFNGIAVLVFLLNMVGSVVMVLKATPAAVRR